MCDPCGQSSSANGIEPLIELASVATHQLPFFNLVCIPTERNRSATNEIATKPLHTTIAP